MARIVCVKPCPPTPLPSVHIPFLPGPMLAQGQLTLEGGCAGCDLLGQIMLQLSVFLSGLGPILCILGCVGSVIQVAQAIPAVIGPPPDPTKILTALANVVIKCECVIELALPFPIGALCEFVKLVADMIHLIVSVLTCIVGLLEHLISLSLKANLLLMDEDVSVQQAGQCLLGQSQGMSDALVTKMGSLQALFLAIAPLIDLLSAVPGLGSAMSGINAAFALFTGGVTVGVTPPAGVLSALQDLQTALTTVDTVVAAIASACP